MDCLTFSQKRKLHEKKGDRQDRQTKRTDFLRFTVCPTFFGNFFRLPFPRTKDLTPKAPR